MRDVMHTPNRRLLIAYAHPDDESFGLGAMIGKYVAEGAEVYYVCATNGDVGTVNPELLEGYSSVAELRLAELDRASAILGFKQVFKLGFKDSGMMGSPENDDPASLWYIGKHQPADVTRRMVEVIRQVQPQVVVTFNKYGGYGHPDHIAIQRATTEAFKLAGDADYETGQAPYAPQKLYYSNIPKAMIQIGVAIMRLRGMNPRQAGRNKDIDVQAILDNIEPAHARLNIGAYYDIWDRASACHVSQGGGGRGFIPLPKWSRKYLVGSQHFTRVYPAPTHSNIDETDLFANVDLTVAAANPLPVQ
ncbi:MAG: PIG-L family deacetylase [Armatimonadetes bacterium]|nr:PIG-L family deacetylase [Anaerolineae bacterium]